MTWEWHWWYWLIYGGGVVIIGLLIGFFHLDEKWWFAMLVWPIVPFFAVAVLIVGGVFYGLFSLGEYLREKWEARK